MLIQENLAKHLFFRGSQSHDFAEEIPIPIFEAQISRQAQRIVNLEAQISWQAQRFVSFEVQITLRTRHLVNFADFMASPRQTSKRNKWQAQRFGSLEAQFSWHGNHGSVDLVQRFANLAKCIDFVAGAALCEPCRFPGRRTAL